MYLHSRNGMNVCAQSVSHVRLFATLCRAVAQQAPLSMRFPRQEHAVSCHFLLQGGLPDPGIEPISPALAGRVFTTKPPRKPHITECLSTNKIVLSEKIDG